MSSLEHFSSDSLDTLSKVALFSEKIHRNLKNKVQGCITPLKSSVCPNFCNRRIQIQSTNQALLIMVDFQNCSFPDIFVQSSWIKHELPNIYLKLKDYYQLLKNSWTNVIHIYFCTERWYKHCFCLALPCCLLVSYSLCSEVPSILPSLFLFCSHFNHLFSFQPTPLPPSYIRYLEHKLGKFWSWKVLEFWYWFCAIWWLLLGIIQYHSLLSFFLLFIFSFLFFSHFSSFFPFPFFFSPFSSPSNPFSLLFSFLLVLSFPFFPLWFVSPLSNFWCGGGTGQSSPSHWLHQWIAFTVLSVDTLYFASASVSYCTTAIS